MAGAPYHIIRKIIEERDGTPPRYPHLRPHLNYPQNHSPPVYSYKIKMKIRSRRRKAAGLLGLMIGLGIGGLNDYFTGRLDENSKCLIIEGIALSALGIIYQEGMKVNY